MTAAMTELNSALPHLTPGFYPARQNACVAEPLVLLHGWGCDSRIWGDFAHRLNAYFNLHVIDLPGFGESSTCEQTLEALLEALPARAYLLGWSLGGMLATQLAAQHPERVLGVISLAANACFVARDTWPDAMAEDVYQGFYQSVAAKPAAALKRFSLLCSNGLDKAQAQWVRGEFMAAQALSPAYEAGLNWLAILDNRAAIAGLTLPALYCFAEQDQLVPVAAGRAVAALTEQAPCPGVVAQIPGCHGAFWQTEHNLVERIVSFATAHQPQRNKQDVARSFSRAAASYDSVAGLQRAVGQALWARFSGSVPAPATVLDLGSGTGFFSGFLKNHWPSAHVISADLSLGMLAFDKQHNTQAAKRSFCTADAEQLPFADGSVEFIFSNLAVQWCEQSGRLLAELRRVLAPGGRALIATLGPGTMAELQNAWAQVDDYQHVNNFTAPQVLAEQGKVLGFERVVLEQQTQIEWFDDFKALSHSLKALGAHNVNHGQGSGLTSRAKLKQLIGAYEQQRTEKGLPLTYEVAYLCLS